MAETFERRYIEAVRRLRVRVDHLEELARWKDDLASRLWRAMAVTRATGQSINDMAALELEVQHFCAVAAEFAKSGVSE